MKRKLLALLAATGCFLGLAAHAKADIEIIHADGHHETIPSPMWAIIVYDASGKATTTAMPNPNAPAPDPKPKGTAN